VDHLNAVALPLVKMNARAAADQMTEKKHTTNRHKHMRGQGINKKIKTSKIIRSSNKQT